MRWKAITLLLGVCLGVVVGCKQQCFVTECDLEHYRQAGLMPPRGEADPAATVIPPGPDVAAPPTTRFPERRPRPITLAEAIALALEHGSEGSPQLNGTTNDQLAALQGGQFVPPEQPIRVLALQPAVAATDIEAALSKFDVRYTGSMIWQRVDQPVGGNQLQNFQNGDTATFSQSLLKPLPTGGVSGITFSTQYTNLINPPFGIINPAYRPRLQFQFEQPLLQGFGVEINELRAQHPGSILTPYNNSSRVEGILITRTRFDQQRAEFERQVNTMLVNVEVAYWNLYGSYFGLFSREQILTQAVETWRLVQQRYEVNAASPVDVAQARSQYELFRGQRLDALNAVLEAEHQLRGLLGLPIEDGTRLVPVDTPTLAPYQPDWNTALADALALRPELVLARGDLKLRQFQVMNQRNLLLPDLRFLSTYDINSFGTHLGGGAQDPLNALANLANNNNVNHGSEWELGLRLDMPIGRRDAYAGLRAARLQLAQSYLNLRDQEERARRFLGQQYRLLFNTYDAIQAQRAQRQALSEELKGRLRSFFAGIEEATATNALSFLLETQRFYADTLRTEYNAVVEYNNALARFEFARGTIMQHDNVFVAEGPLPHCAQVRAVEHERKRAKALLLRERAAYPYNPADALPHAGAVTEQSLEGRLGAILDPMDASGGAPPVPPILDREPAPVDPVSVPPMTGEPKGEPLPMPAPARPAAPATSVPATATPSAPVYGMILTTEPPTAAKGPATGPVPAMLPPVVDSASR